MSVKAKVYFGCPRPIRITSFSSSGGLVDSHAPRPRAGNFLRPHGLNHREPVQQRTERNTETEVYLGL